MDCKDGRNDKTDPRWARDKIISTFIKRPESSKNELFAETGKE